MPKQNTALATKDGKTPAPIQKVTASPQVDQLLSKSRAITEADFYEVERWDKSARTMVKIKKPNARALQYEANKSGFGGIATKIIDAGMDHEHGWARIQGWPVNQPDFVKEEQVTIFFEFEFAQLLFDRIKNGCDFHKKGCPIITDPATHQPILSDKTGLPVLELQAEQMAILSQVLRTKKFADRTCITKCEARLHEKFLNMEWRDPEEVEHEQAEVEQVNASRKAEPAVQQAPAQNKEPEKAPEPPPKQEATKKGPAPKKPVPPKEPQGKETATHTAAGIPKAQIPPDPLAEKKAPEQEKPKTIQDRAARLATTTASSTTHVVEFFMRQLKVSNLKDSRKEDVERMLSACEATIASGIQPFEFGAYMRGDKTPEAVEERFKQMLEGGK